MKKGKVLQWKTVMRPHRLVVLLFFILIGSVSFVEKEVPGEVFTSKDKVRRDHKIRKIVIDPGHGGNDPGCVGLKSKEKDVVLSISLLLGKMINQALPDVEVIYTRKTDVFLELHQRSALANRVQADLFISIHCNASESKSSKGTETFVLGLHRAKDNLDVAKRENASIYFETDYESNYDGYDPNSAQGHILLSMFQNAFLDQSIYLAEKIESNFKSYNRVSRGVKQGGFLVLRHATMPAVLVEAGFLSNADEEQWLLSSEGQAAIAQSILNAIVNYKNTYEQKDSKRSAPLASQENPASKTEPVVNTGNEVEFCVQYQSTSNPRYKVDDKISAHYTIHVRMEGGLYKHQAGNLLSYESAMEAKEKIRSMGYKDAFIVAYIGDKKVSVQEALSHIANLAHH